MELGSPGAERSDSPCPATREDVEEESNQLNAKPERCKNTKRRSEWANSICTDIVPSKDELDSDPCIQRGNGGEKQPKLGSVEEEEGGC